MKPVRRFGPHVLLAAILLPAVGCFVGSTNPSRIPSWFGSSRIKETHAKPGGRGYFANFDPDAVRLEVRPLRATNPVRTQHLVIATVLDDKGNALRKRRVEWNLEGVGTIIEVDESGLLPGRGYKVDRNYAVSYTDYFEHTVSRGNGNPDDDFVIRPGQTWCIVTSPVEGESRLTVYAPEIYDWDRRTAVVSMYWSDCQWQFPTPTSARSGSPHTLTTHLFRREDRTPVPNVRVRYRLLDNGPPAELLPARGREVIATSDPSGNASVAIRQLDLQPGTNRVGIEIIRPSADGGAPIVLASEETTIDWQAPQLQVKLEAPPAAALGQEIPATITVINSGQVDTQSGRVYFKVPPGLSVMRSDPPARADERGYLTWELSSLPAGRQQVVNVSFKAREKGTFPARVAAITRDSLRAEQDATLRVEPGGLRVSINGPRTGVVGVPVDCEIQVSNPSSAEVSRILLDLWLGPNLVAVAPNGTRFENKLQNDRIPPLGPGETRTLPIKFDATRPGRLEVRALASADGGLSAEQATVIDFQAPQVEVQRKGAPRVYIGRDETWALHVRNAGEVPVSGAVLRDRLPPELTFRAATDGGVFDPRSGEIVWNLGNLAAGAERIVRVTAYAARPATRAVLAGRLTGEPNLDLKAENTVEVLGVPALRVDVTADANPVDVGRRVTYTVRITNQGTLPLDKVDVAAEVPAVMRALGGRWLQQVAPRGNTITFPAVVNLQPNQTATLYVFAQAVEAGDARLRVVVQSAPLAQPLVTEEATRILAPLSPPR